MVPMAMQTLSLIQAAFEPLRRSAWGRWARALCMLTAAVLPAGIFAADWDFEPRVILGQNWTDNVTLAPSGAESSEWITELKPGFSLSTDGQRVKLDLDYEAQALWFADNSDFDEVYQTARGAATFALVPRTLFMDAALRYGQQGIDPSAQLDYTNLFNTGNRTDVLFYKANPYHVGRWGSWGESLVSYEWQEIRYRNIDEGAGEFLEDSNLQIVSASLGSPSDRAGVSWRLSGSSLSTEYEQAPEFRQDRVMVDLGMPVGSFTRATVVAGRESDIAADISEGGLDSTFWYLGFEWEPSELQSLRVRGGERYYGTAWDVQWMRRGSRGELRVEYSEDPTTASGVLSSDDVFSPGFQPGPVPTLDTRVFLRKSLFGIASYELDKATIGVRIFHDRRQFEDDFSESERNFGAALNFDWHFAPRTTLGTSLDFNRLTLDDSDNDSDWWGLTARLTRQLTRTLSGTLSGEHRRQTLDETGDELRSRANRIALYLTATF